MPVTLAGFLLDAGEDAAVQSFAASLAGETRRPVQQAFLPHGFLSGEPPRRRPGFGEHRQARRLGRDGEEISPGPPRHAVGRRGIPLGPLLPAPPQEGRLPGPIRLARAGAGIRKSGRFLRRFPVHARARRDLCRSGVLREGGLRPRRILGTDGPLVRGEVPPHLPFVSPRRARRLPVAGRTVRRLSTAGDHPDVGRPRAGVGEGRPGPGGEKPPGASTAPSSPPRRT